MMFKKKDWKIKFKDCLTIGKFTYGLDRDCFIGLSNEAPIQIGMYCSFGPNVKMFLNSDHPINLVSTFPLKTLVKQKSPWPNLDVISKGGVTIGNDVWVGANSLIMSGVKISSGSVIAAGSIVTKDVGPYQLVGGNPAKLIKTRFNKKQIDSLLRIKWWNWSEEKIISEIDDFYNDVTKFIKKHDK